MYAHKTRLPTTWVIVTYAFRAVGQTRLFLLVREPVRSRRIDEQPHLRSPSAHGTRPTKPDPMPHGETVVPSSWQATTAVSTFDGSLPTAKVKQRQSIPAVNRSLFYGKFTVA